MIFLLLISFNLNLGFSTAFKLCSDQISRTNWEIFPLKSICGRTFILFVRTFVVVRRSCFLSVENWVPSLHCQWGASALITCSPIYHPPSPHYRNHNHGLIGASALIILFYPPIYFFLFTPVFTASLKIIQDYNTIATQQKCHVRCVKSTNSSCYLSLFCVILSDTRYAQTLTFCLWAHSQIEICQVSICLAGGGQYFPLICARYLPLAVRNVGE